MNQLFNYEGNQVRTSTIEGVTWFVASDICSALEIGNTSDAVRRLDDDEKGIVSIDTLGGTQSMICVNESGLYELILGSRKKEAKDFKRWIKRDVLPSIRKTGSYSIQVQLPQNYKEALIALVGKVEENERLEANNLQLVSIIETDKPKVQFAETCMTSDRSILVREVAKLASKQGVMIGERRLFQKLRDWGMFTLHYNEPTQRAMEMGLFELKKGVYAHPDGAKDYTTPKVTVKGQMYIINRLLKEAA